ncbi:hypothetical protein [Sphaerisporangium sp. NPDC051011]|uniref:hypothetical protein n=1 Tax=Sphaerisporangium sp. NPDC051011 TaxID=3155792 RepID=UPI0033EE9433
MPPGRPGQVNASSCGERRRVGKSSLVEEFLRRTETPNLFFTAAGGTAEDELTELLDAVARSTLPERGLFSEETPHRLITNKPPGSPRVRAPDIAERAGHSMDVLLRVYAKCIDGQRDMANKRTAEALSA